MIQDLTPGNLLVDDECTGGSGMRLLFADLGMATCIGQLKRRCAVLAASQLHVPAVHSAFERLGHNGCCISRQPRATRHCVPPSVQKILACWHLAVGIHGGAAAPV